MWATPQEGGDTIKLGALGLGRGVFKTKRPFTNIFVTTERTRDVKTPQGPTVMRGNVRSIEPFFEAVATPSPTPSPDSEEVDETDQEVSEEPQALTTREKFLLALRRAGIAALVALVALVGLIFVVTRSRG
jgi:hypothetical protein